jgi:hypothetical protein
MHGLGDIGTTEIEDGETSGAGLGRSKVAAAQLHAQAALEFRIANVEIDEAWACHLDSRQKWVMLQPLGKTCGQFAWISPLCLGRSQCTVALELSQIGAISEAHLSKFRSQSLGNKGGGHTL